MKKYKHIFFDLDRTLWDFEKNSSETLREIVEKFSLSEYVSDFDKWVKQYHYYNDKLWNDFRDKKINKTQLRETRFRLLFRDYNIPGKGLVQAISRFYMNRCPEKTELVKDARELLEYLRKEYFLYVITNGFYDTQLSKIINSGIFHYFNKIFTSDRIGYAKPNPGFFNYVVNSVHAKKSESLVIGDDEINDITGARNSGIDQVFFNPDNLTFSVKPTYEIRTLSDLQKIL